MITLFGRKVKVQTGRKSQTVNVCSLDNIHGQYDYIIRLFHPNITSEIELERNRFTSFQQMVDFLVNKYNAKIESAPGIHKDTMVELPSSEHESDNHQLPVSDWVLQAKRIVEESINQLMNEFIQYPYLHRVEHSLHCQFYNILTADDLFNRKYTINKYTFQPVHKEWPEWKPRPDKNNRRGNFDISIIEPTAIKHLDDFKKGRIRPSIVIELGLDYDLNHLQQDARKFINSKIQYPYLIHFIRENFKFDNFPRVEEFILNSSIPTAYARISANKAYFKTLNSNKIEEKNF